MRHVLSLVIVTLAASTLVATDRTTDDPLLWLEGVEDADALAWVKQQNERSTSTLEKVPEFESIRQGILEVYNSDEKIPDVTIRGDHLYNFWQDATHVRGLWRRTSIEEYRKDEPTWETVLDVDRLAEAEGENWAWGTPSCLPPEYRRCMVGLSHGGTDAEVYREFDTVDKAFVEGGFVVPEAKSYVYWRDQDTLWVATDFGEGTLTTSGYPRITTRWSRGTPLAEAAKVLEVPEDHVGVAAYSDHTPDGSYDLVMDTPQFFRGTHYLVLDDRKVRLDLPADVDMKGMFKDQLLISLRTDWTVAETTYPQGALLAIDLDDFLQGKRTFETLFEPSERVSLDEIATTRNRLVLTTLDNVRGRLYVMGFEEGAWSRHELPTPGLGSLEIKSTSYGDDTWFFTYTDFLTPTTLFLVEEDLEPVAVKRSPAFFDASGMKVAQYEATSKDGTSIPYFVVTPEGFEANGTAPTVLYGYGGFEIPMLPRYSDKSGSAWLARGGVWVLSNIRGGGEFGPRWHQGVLKENRHKVYEDFIAVAEDLIDRKITSPEHLGIMGGSQGGLLVGVAALQRPDLFSAVVSQVPLLDMGRYHKLLAGASWMAEYGNPDVPEEWAFIQTWSPYHMVRKGVDYPEIFFRTNTRDDRVHPGHPRKMVARMLDQGHPVLYWEDIQGGHSAGTTNEARAYGWALDYAYLWMKLR